MRFSLVADEIQPNADEIQPSADEIQPSADEIQPSADEIQPNADEIQPWLECLTVNAPVAMVQGSIPASVGTVESEGNR